jgi:predicted porin
VSNSIDARSWNLGLKYQVTGPLWLAANVLKVDDKQAANQDRNLNALGLEYAMSKRTVGYVRWEDGDNDKSNGAVGNFTRYQIGMRHSF